MNLLRSLVGDPASPAELAYFVFPIIWVLLAGAGYLVAVSVALRGIRRWAVHFRQGWIEPLCSERMLRTLAAMVPFAILHRGARTAFLGAPTVAGVVERLTLAIMALLALVAMTHLFHAADRIYNRFAMARERPIKGLLQLMLIFFYSIGAVWIIALLLDKPAWGFISGIGALSAVLLLVFKDTLLGIAASFQIGANNMVAIGDWIEMPKYNADGDVIDISLQTIKVRNWDKTITTIPIYALVSDSFKNWRGMFDSGGRRIMRSICIDMRSIQFCDPDMIERFRKMSLLHDYVEGKIEEIDRFNRENQIDVSIPANGRRMTNIGTFRAYMTEYLKRHPGLRKDMMLMVRQLDPGPTGLPLQAWAFTSTTVWTEYEAIQADIFDHLLSVLPAFNLRPFQDPSGWDMENIGGRIDRNTNREPRTTR